MLRTSCSRAITYLANPSELPSWHRRGGCAAGADGVVGQVPKQFLTKSPNSGCQSTRENSMLYLTYHPGASRHPSCARRGVRSDLPSTEFLLGRLQFLCRGLRSDVLSGNRRAPELPLKIQRDLAAVKAAILDENLVRAVAGDNDTGKVDARDVGFERFQVDAGFAIREFSDLYADASKEIKIG